LPSPMSASFHPLEENCYTADRALQEDVGQGELRGPDSEAAGRTARLVTRQKAYCSARSGFTRRHFDELDPTGRISSGTTRTAIAVAGAAPVCEVEGPRARHASPTSAPDQLRAAAVGGGHHGTTGYVRAIDGTRALPSTHAQDDPGYAHSAAARRAVLHCGAREPIDRPLPTDPHQGKTTSCAAGSSRAAVLQQALP